MTTLQPTPGQTVGPFFHYGLEIERGNELVPPHTPDAVLLTGRVLDGNGDPLQDALVEIWQTDAAGNVPRGRAMLRRPSYIGTHPVRREGTEFTGFGRSATTAEGEYSFWTVNPGAAADGSAPFFAVAVFARGLMNKLHTRIYLPEASDAIASDALLSSLTDEERASLVASRDERGNLHHDIRLQGEKETIFLAFN
ncbi:protocatechuate 3,4-dioxygenase subunit alpha [Salinibacterium sp. ZJ454]|uniref:protocatechuate 3,4-dioxygenase subunit alpha n=1 Tax=Salinibacterium sp. ZJ454 TaxID=2708339 RepID=UPI00141F639B|nr:protocatechuate 3,4-dioxygenase subunit alpha [Salinibacterium sp. ZJ454]